MEETTIDKIHPKIRPLVQAFMLRCKYPYKLMAYGRLSRIPNSEGSNDYFPDSVFFYDVEAPTLKHAGGIRWTEKKFRVITRREQHGRFKDGERRMSIETTDEKRALKEMLKHITPYSVNDIARSHWQEARNVGNMWRNEHSAVIENTFNSVSPKVILEELRNLLAQGIKFVTPEFQKLVDAGMAAYEETERRKNTTMYAYFVRVKSGGVFEVLSPERSTNELNGNVTTYNLFEELPEFIQETIAMLRLLDDNARIPGVGARISPTGFWVIQRDE